jgi:YtxH-like protein
MTLKDVTHLDTDRLREVMGLETQRSTGEWLVGILSAFGVGLLVGAGVGLMFAPKAGRGLREDLRYRLRQVSDGLSGAESAADFDPDMAGA